MSGVVADLQQRELALDVADSCAVQAPAGSGKTELLSLRFLKLLAVVENPEEVLAITFTRKAASEMSNRILDTLEWADGLSRLPADEQARALEDSLNRSKYQVAREVLEHDASLGWNLLRNASRLRIQTIDSFSNYLASRLPLQSRLGGTAQVSEDTEACYLEAVSATLDLLDSPAPEG